VADARAGQNTADRRRERLTENRVNDELALLENQIERTLE
jgi:hypothetical protein